MNIACFGGRRFLLCVGAGVVTSVLQALGKLDAAGSTYSMVILGTVGAYVTGNTAQKVLRPVDSLPDNANMKG